jgi:hypothetical protein
VKKEMLVSPAWQKSAIARVGPEHAALHGLSVNNDGGTMCQQGGTHSIEKLLRDSEAEESIQGNNDQPCHIDCRRNNDPAAPMLKALCGPEWTA